MSDTDPRPRPHGQGFSTRAIRAASRIPSLDQTPTSVPIYQTATFASADAEELGRVAADARLASPTAGSPTRPRAPSAPPTRSWPVARPASPWPRGWARSTPRSRRCCAAATGSSPRPRSTDRHAAQMLPDVRRVRRPGRHRRHDRPRRGGRCARRGTDQGPLRGDDRQPDDRDRRPRRARRPRPPARRDVRRRQHLRVAVRLPAARARHGPRRRVGDEVPRRSQRRHRRGRRRVGGAHPRGRARPDRYRRDPRAARCLPRPARHPDPRHPGPNATPRPPRHWRRGSSVRTACRASCTRSAEPSAARRGAAPVPARRGRRDARLRGRRGPRRRPGDHRRAAGSRS